MAQNESEPRIEDLPIGTGATGERIESDSMGKIAVPADHYWGAQTAAVAASFCDRYGSDAD